ncbi:hypothetical protein ACS0TY_009290 [Phlomoides rotata]
MEYVESAAAAKVEGCPSSLSSSASSDPVVVLSPCAACKTLRRRCAAERCILAPYFPPTELNKFTIAHRVFGASNIIKLLQELPEIQRADAVNSMVYEANARIRDPIYGCAGAICHLMKQIDELQAELAKAHAEILNMQCQNANLLDQFCKHEVINTVQDNLTQATLPYDHQCSTFLFDEGNLGVSWT